MSGPIWISKTANGIVLRRDGTELHIAAAAVPLALGAVIHELTDAGRAIGEARREGREMGLREGYAACEREHEQARLRRERMEADARDLLATLELTTIAACAA